MKKGLWFFSTLLVFSLLLAACAPAASTTASPTQAAALPTATTAAELPDTGTQGTAVNVSQNEQFGSFLVDSKGMSLYLFTKDTPNVSNCYDQCATNWPPLLTTGAPVAGDGVDDSLFGTTQRTDGTMQVTYNGWPLYYYIKDKAAGDTVGQLVGDVWYLVSPTGEMITTAPTSASDVPAASGAGTTVAMSKNDQFGEFLVDDKGMSLYLFTKDTPNVSNCYDECATNWPPLLTTGKPMVGDGVDDSKLGTTERKDGTMQVTYNGWPLYYFAKDTKAGDTTGQEVGDVWYLISPEGVEIESSSSASGTEVKLATNAQFGDFLVDDEGMSLYLFTRDTANTSTCYDECAVKWPPLLTTGDPEAGDGVDQALLGTTERTDGTMQVTYNGWPLYYWWEDKAAGDVNGQGVGDVWYLVNPAGEGIGAQ
jgi:predicted lipoprotein with Yx(FWY)xxD motif